MMLIQQAELELAEAIAAIGYTNPFLPERVLLERQALGPEFVSTADVLHWQPRPPLGPDDPKILLLRDRAQRLADDFRRRLCDGVSASERELRLYQDVVLYLLYARYMARFDDGLQFRTDTERASRVKELWRLFAEDFRQFMNLPERSLPTHYDPALVYAVLFQLHRAFTNIYECLVGSSMPIARLRAAVWQSIFSHDMRRYGRTLYKWLGDVPTLILGASGTGKELVARAIGFSRFVPFDTKHETFSAEDLTDFHAVNLSALSSSLVESELFGHRKGAFTGAISDRVGWLEASGAAGTVFLDEIGELDPLLQVKLLRVLQSREFHRVGESVPRAFRGKIVAATNRNLALEMHAGRFREDLYYRLCADLVQTPTLHEQLVECPDDLDTLVAFLSQRIIPDEPTEAAALAQEVTAWIRTNLGEKYEWPGNIRELEQCTRNIMIRGAYTPSQRPAIKESASALDGLAENVVACRWTVDELLQHYSSLAFVREGSYVAAAKRLQVNWRTIRDRTLPELVASYRQDAEPSTRVPS